MGHRIQKDRTNLSRNLTSALIATSTAIALQQFGVLQVMETSILDQFFHLRLLLTPSSKAPLASPVTLVTVSEEELVHLPQWPLSDAELAEVLTGISQAGPAAIGLHLHRNIPVQPGQAQLAQVLATTSNLVGIEKVVDDEQVPQIAAPSALSTPDRVAASDLVPDSDGKLRRHLISLGNKEGDLRLSLGAKLAFQYLEQQGIVAEPSPTNPSHIQLGQAWFRPLISHDGGYVKEDTGGYQILSNFYPSPRAFERISLQDLQAGTIPWERLRDRIVLFGPAASSLQHQFFIPTTLRPEQGWYGIELQADLTSQIIMAATSGRPLLHAVPRSVGWLWILSWSLVGAYIESLFPLHRLSLRASFPLGLILLWSSGYGLFLQGWWIVTAAPGLSMVMAGLLRQQLQLNNSLARSQNQLEAYTQTFEKTLIHQIKVRTHSLQKKNRALIQAKQTAERASEAKSAFLARMSHELRIPLNSILGFSRILNEDSNLAPESQENLDIIQSSGEHLLSLINDVLDISRIEANQLKLNERAVHLSNFLDRLEAMFHLQAAQKSIAFRCSVDGQLPEHIWIDETKLRQVLINLLGNAIKFTQYGHVILRTWSKADQPQNLYFEVEDTGPGILQTEQENIFAPFIQGVASNEKLTGTGLGLFISRQLVQCMGGEISVSSQWGKGARFQVILPLRAAERPATKPRTGPRTGLNKGTMTLGDTQSTITPLSKLGKRVLIVDDIAFNRKLLAKMLSDLGMEVREACNGKDAINLWASWKPELIMMDMCMPQMDGYTATRHIREIEADQHLAATPIIATSGALMPEERSAALDAGCSDLAQKPFEREQLLDVITTALRA